MLSSIDHCTPSMNVAMRTRGDAIDAVSVMMTKASTMYSPSASAGHT